MAKFSVSLVRGYQKYISPLFPPTCRYYPTCSHYTVQALEKHGTLKGSIMGFARILRCNPFVEGGYDQVPDYFTLRRNPDNQLPSQQLSDEELMDLLLEDYQEDILINEAKLETTLTSFVTYQKVDESELGQAYLDQVFQYTDALGVNPPAFHLLKITQFNDSSYETDHYHSDLNEALDDDHQAYILTEDQLGVVAASSDQLAVDLVLAQGVRQSDILDRTPRLMHYLRVLDQLQV